MEITQKKSNPTKVLLMAMPDTVIGFNVAARLPNLGLASIAANRDPNESDIKILDLVLCRHALLRCIKKALDRVKPEIVGLSCMIFQYQTARRIAKWIKEEYNENIVIVFGGYFPTVGYDYFGPNYTAEGIINYKDPLNECPWCDFIVRGEGEITFREFIHEYRNDKNYSKIKGLSWRDKEGVFHHNPPRENADLSKLKLPDRNARLIKRGFHNVGKLGALVETSRGCTNMCKFCSIACMYGRTVRYYSIDRVIEDIKRCKKSGIKSILFIDDNITLDPERFEKICDRIIKEKLKMEYHVQASVAGLLSRPNLIKKMKKAGFSIIFFGIENVNPRNLKFFKKSVPIKRIKFLVDQLHKNGMLTFGGFILGNPDDDLKSFEYNFKFAKYLDLDIPAWQIITPFPRTETREELIQQGLVTNLNDFSKYNGIYANVKTKYLSPEIMNRELIRLYARYYTPMWFTKRLFYPRLWKFFPYTLHVGIKFAKYVLPAWRVLISAFRSKTMEERMQKENMVIQFFNKVREFRDKIIEF
ncbi:MAG: B12-binding domain-containing radical SAM protein [Promethearchaeota archaeon]